MKLIRKGEIGEETPGLLLADGREVDVSAFGEDYDEAFFETNGMERLSEWVRTHADSSPGFPDSMRWGSPIARPSKIVCIGLNYKDHAEESGVEIPEEPVIFFKATSAFCGPNDNLIIPRNSEKTDWEVELGVVIGQDALYLDSVEEAENYIAGYCISQDVSERAFQLEREGQWTKGKSCPTFNPLGPYLYPASDIGDANNLAMELKVNGEIKQSGNTKNMIFSPSFLVHYLSQFMLLEAGDVLSTGTPAGVGAGMTPPQFLRNGDVVELSIEKLGTQKQTFKAYQTN